MNAEKPNRPIDAIVFDIGNVLLTFDYSLAINTISRRNNLPSPPDEKQLFAIRDLYERDALSHEGFLAQTRSLFSDQGTEKEFIADWVDIFEPNQPMIDFVKARAAADTHPLYLLSNIGKIHADYLLNKHSFFEHFQDTAFSYKLRAAKPESAIYERTSRHLHLENSQVLFIDDREENILAARAHGWTAIHYDYTRHDDFLRQIVGLGLTP
ncbi:MAG: HAD family hydrolase [Chthoniobacterales bacterium]